MTTWTVLAPGPSLKHFGNPQGPIVAVNTAVLVDWPVDFWACQDPPLRFEENVMKRFDEKRIARLDDILVWCPSDQQDFWTTRGFRVWPHSNLNATFCEDCLGKVPDDVKMTALTITAAITRCIGLGATKIELYGCDMDGVGYAYGKDAANRSKKLWEERWVKERETFAKALKAWEPVEIIRK